MADKIVQLVDKNNDNIYPIASVPNAAKITMTDVDPGEGSPLAADNYIAVYGGVPTLGIIGAMTIYGNYHDSDALANATIGLDTAGSSVGTGLTFDASSFAIKIGANVSKILVSSSVFFKFKQRAYGWYEIRKNGQSIGLSAISNLTNNSYDTATICPVVLDVTENDTINLFNIEEGVIRGTNTYLTVIAIG